MSSSSDSTMMPMSSMMMTFFNSHTTPLFSASWTPSTTGQYAGTCIFLIFFGAIYHTLGAIRTHWLHRLRDIEHNRRIPITDGSGKKNDGTTKGTNPSRSFAEIVPVLTKLGQKNRPWRFSTDLPRALLDTLIAGIGYLLWVAFLPFLSNLQDKR